MKKLRASAAPLYDACPGAAYGDEDALIIDPNDPAGRLGSAVHEALAPYVQGGPRDVPSDIVGKYHLDDDQATDMRIMFYIGAKCWDEYKEAFGDEPMVECELQHGDMTGHTDVLGIASKVVRVLDWKSTRLEACNYSPQMMQYLYLAWKRVQQKGTHDDFLFQYVIVFLRDKSWDISPLYTPQDLQAWYDQYIERVMNWDGKTYCPGGNCTFCPRVCDCPALREQLVMIRQMVNPDDIAEALQSVTPAMAVTLYENIRLAEKKLAHAIEILKLRADATEGGLVGDGKALVMKESKKQTISAKEAWPIMQEELDDDDIADCISVRKTSLLKKISDGADRGKKKQAKEDFMERLEEAGAVETSTIKKVALVAVQPQIESSEVEGEDDAQEDD